MLPEEARTELRRLLPPGSTVHTVLRHVSRSGMTRAISPVISFDGQPGDASWLFCLAVPGWKTDPKHGGIRVGGAGMDMGFHLVYTLSGILYPEGFVCIGERCPANSHVNGDRDYTPHAHPNAGGYALRQTWL